MSYGLKEDVIQKICAVFADHGNVREAVLYGSRAKGNYKPGSDIDIVLKGEELNLDTLNSIRLQLDDLLLPYMMDVSLYSHIDNAALLDHIARVGMTLYQRD